MAERSREAFGPYPVTNRKGTLRRVSLQGWRCRRTLRHGENVAEA